MDRVAFRLSLLMLAVFPLSQWGARCLAPEVARETPMTEPAQERAWVTMPPPVLELAEAPRADLDVPDTCRRLIVRTVSTTDHRTGRTYRKRQLSGKSRPEWLGSHALRWRRQQDLRALVRVVVTTMGGDDLAAEMIWRKAIYESSGDPSNVHILNRDIDANVGAAGKGRKRATDRWKRARVPAYERRRGRLVQAGDYDAWALGRGLYGQVTGLHMHRWSADAPPWSLCDPIIATVTTVWAMRAGLEQCGGSTLRDAYRRFSSGKCEIREHRLERRFDRLARGHVRGLKLKRFNPDARAVLGDRWDEATADRAVLLALLRAKVLG